MTKLNLSKLFARWSIVLLGVSVYPFTCTIFHPEIFSGYPLAFLESGSDNFHKEDNDLLEESQQILVNSEVDLAFTRYNKELEHYNHIGALLAWNASMNMSSSTLKDNGRLMIEKNIWNNHWCGELLKLQGDTKFGHLLWDKHHERGLYLICRGPRFSSYQLSNIVSVLGSLQQLYNKEVCLKSINQCMRMEPELNRFMERSRNEKHLREAWLAWHEDIGSEMKPLYASLVRMLNQGAIQGGFRDMGECWREEIEIDNLKGLVTDLYSDVKYLYSLLHAYVRHKLEEFYGVKFNNGLIPAHLLGNMWAQKWDSLMDILWDEDEKSEVSKQSSPLTTSKASTYLVNKYIRKEGNRNITVIDMVKAAEDFFVSMGLPNLPNSFWENSYFEENVEEVEVTGSKEDLSALNNDYGNNRGKIKLGKMRPPMKANSKNCHGSAANMFGGKKEDYRILMCAQVNDEDFITIHHEIGHIMYFMAYSKLPTIFQEGANSAFHESVGDAITYDLLSSPRGNKVESLFKTGLFKLPQIGFGLVMDMWRWKVFETPYRVSEWNKEWWKFNEQFLGITRPFSKSPPGDTLDAAGKFHIIDNIPYVRYFLASFLQVQFYESLCKASSPFWNGDLHSCHIRDSYTSGQVLWNMMQKGTTQHWSKTLFEMTGSKQIDSKALLSYYQPLQTWLEMKIFQLNLTIGW